MRTIVEIDDELLAQAMRVTGVATKRAVLALALETLLSRAAPPCGDIDPDRPHDAERHPGSAHRETDLACLAAQLNLSPSTNS